VSERGKGCPDHHNGVQTIWQGRGSRGRSSGWGWTMASATRRRSGRSHRARQAISYVIAMLYDHIVRNTVSMSYLPDIASVVNTTSKAMSYLPDIGVRRRIRYRRSTYDIVYDVVTYDWQEQSSHLRYRTKTRNRIRYRRFDIRYRIRCDLRCRTYDWQEQYLDLRCDLRCRTFRDIVYDIVG
jgi:hypothetical protein